MMKQNITIITLGVNNLSESQKFYEDILGWQKTNFSNENIVFFQMNGFLLSLYPIEKLAEDAQQTEIGKGFKNFTLAHNLNSELEVDNFIETLRSKGVKIIKEPQKVFWGGYSSYFSDPNNFLWEIAFNPYL